jgi:hypothetical protein
MCKSLLCIELSIVVCFLAGCGSGSIAVRSSASDATYIAEYIMVTKVHSSISEAFSESYAKITAGDAKIDGISGALAKMESGLRFVCKQIDESNSQLDSLTLKVQSPLIQKWLGVYKKYLDSKRVFFARSISLLEEVGGSGYKFMARQDEIMELFAAGGSDMEIDDLNEVGIQDSAYAAANRVLGW